MGQVVQGMAPFPVKVRGITGHGEEYLFLNVVRGNDPLIDLHDRLYSGSLAAHLMPEIPYHPHVTVGRLADPTEFSNALALAREMGGTFETVVREIATVRIERDGEIWEEIRVSLGSRAAGQ
jgi:2'-5' RNA ligase